MAKKYVPSGYQIINIIIENDETTIRETEDSLLLSDILKEISDQRVPRLKKPIFITITDIANDNTVMGLATEFGTHICISTVFNADNVLLSYDFYLDDGDLTFSRGNFVLTPDE